MRAPFNHRAASFFGENLALGRSGWKETVKLQKLLESIKQ